MGGRIGGKLELRSEASLGDNWRGPESIILKLVVLSHLVLQKKGKH